MKILVTGGSAFIGSSIVESLSNDHEVLAPSSKELDLTKSIMVTPYLKDNNFDFVIHCGNHHVHPAIKIGRDPGLQLENNLKMFFNIAFNPTLFGNLIYFGSGAEFNRNRWGLKMKEEFFGNSIPNDQYGLSKYIMNTYCRSSDKIYNLRLFGTFGEKDDWRYRFIPYLCAKSVLGQDLVVKQNAIFNFLYIKDMIDILKRFIENPPESGDYNICNDNNQDIELVKIAEIIKEKSNHDRSIIIREDGLSTKYSGDNSKLRKTFPDIVFTPIEKSIDNVYKAFFKNAERFKSSEFLINSSI